MKFRFLPKVAALAFALGANASAAVYNFSFVGLLDDVNLNGFDSWSVAPTVGDVTGDPLGYGAEVGGVRGFQLGGALDAPIGPPVGSTMVASRGVSGVGFVSSGAQPTKFFSNFAIVDSSGIGGGGFNERNDYSISLFDGATELFTVSFAAVPSDPSGMDDAWQVGFNSSAALSVVGANWGVGEYDDKGTPGVTSDDEGMHTISMTFGQGAGSDVNFIVTVAGSTSNTWYGVLSGLSTANITKIEVGSNLGAETDWGDGVIAMSGISLVPEPSSALLAGMAAFGLLRRRRQQA